MHMKDFWVMTVSPRWKKKKKEKTASVVFPVNIWGWEGGGGGEERRGEGRGCCQIRLQPVPRL